MRAVAGRQVAINGEGLSQVPDRRPHGSQEWFWNPGREGLPVHRHQPIDACAAEVDAWLKARGAIAEATDRQAPFAWGKRWSRVGSALLGAGAVTSALWLVLGEQTRRDAFPDLRASIRAGEAGQEILAALSPDGSQVALTWNGPGLD